MLGGIIKQHLLLIAIETFMRIEQRLWTKEGGWTIPSSELKNDAQLVFAFGGRAEIEEPKRFVELQAFYPNAHVLMCSTAGEILGTRVRDNSIAVSAIHFLKTTLQFAHATIKENSESERKGSELAKQLPQDGLRHVMIFSDGLRVNGTMLVKGLMSIIPTTVAITGGLVGDGTDFKKTLLGLDAQPSEGNLVLVGFYGDSIKIGHGSMGGWDSFGPDRLITKSDNNVLYELDGKPALALYKEYLGEEAKGLPGSGLLFPINLKVGEGENETEVVRTLLAVDEEKQSMTFAGDMPEQATATLMKANFEKLVDGARGAAQMSGESIGVGEVEFAILISCVGRKLVLKERIEEETEAVQSVVGQGTPMIGFYSYGEISPVAPTEKQCRLHNQTMTITTFKEV